MTLTSQHLKDKYRTFHSTTFLSRSEVESRYYVAGFKVRGGFFVLL